MKLCALTSARRTCNKFGQRHNSLEDLTALFVQCHYITISRIEPLTTVKTNDEFSRTMHFDENVKKPHPSPMINRERASKVRPFMYRFNRQINNQQEYRHSYPLLKDEMAMYEHGVSDDNLDFIAETEEQARASKAYLHALPGGERVESIKQIDPHTMNERVVKRITAPFDDFVISSRKERFAVRNKSTELQAQSELQPRYTLDNKSHLNLKKEHQLQELLASPMPALAKAQEVCVMLHDFYENKLALQSRCGEEVIMLLSQVSLQLRLQGKTTSSFAALSLPLSSSQSFSSPTKEHLLSAPPSENNNECRSNISIYHKDNSNSNNNSNSNSEKTCKLYYGKETEESNRKWNKEQEMTAQVSQSKEAILNVNVNAVHSDIHSVPFLQEMRDLYSHLKSCFVAPTTLMAEHFMITLCAVQNKNRKVYELAERLFIDADKYVFLPSRTTYAAYFSICKINERMPEAIARMRDAVLHLHLSLDSNMVESLLSGLNELGYVEEAIALLARCDHIPMTTPLLNASLESLLLSNQPQACFTAFRAVGKQAELHLNADTYTLLLLACEQSGNWHEVTFVLSDMQRRRVKGNAQTLNLLLKGLMTEKLNDYAIQLYNTMQQKQVQVWPALENGVKSLVQSEHKSHFPKYNKRNTNVNNSRLTPKITGLTLKQQLRRRSDKLTP